MSGIIAGSFKSQLIDYFRGHVTSCPKQGSFMLIRTKWRLCMSWRHFGWTLWRSQLLCSWRNFYFLVIDGLFSIAYWPIFEIVDLCPFTPGVRVTLRQRYDDACNMALIDHNGVAPKWVATPFSSGSIVVNESYVASAIAVLTLTDSDARYKWALRSSPL